MAIIKNKANQADRDYWSHIEQVAKEVEKWPSWMANRQECAKEAKLEHDRARAAKASGNSASGTK
jgi:hypothetical protein